MEQNNLYILLMVVLFSLSLFLIIFHKYLVKKWYTTYNIEQYDDKEKIKYQRIIIFRQKLGTLFAILGTLFFLFKILKII